MLVVNKLTKPGNTRRIELTPEKVTVTLYDHTELTFENVKRVNPIPSDIQFTPELSHE